MSGTWKPATTCLASISWRPSRGPIVCTGGGLAKPGRPLIRPDEHLTSSPPEGRAVLNCLTDQPESEQRPFSGEIFSCESEGMTARLHLTGVGHLIVEAELHGGLATDRVAQVRVWDEENRPLAEGYLGLYPIENGQAAHGECRLDILAPSLRDMISRGCLCFFGVASQSRRRSSTLDRQVLERSLSAAVRPASRRILEELLSASAEPRRERSTSTGAP